MIHRKLTTLSNLGYNFPIFSKSLENLEVNLNQNLNMYSSLDEGNQVF